MLLKNLYRLLVLAAVFLAHRSPAAGPSTWTMAEVKKHATAQSCWMVIEGRVYDVTPYLNAHPTDPKVLLAWCGKEATQGWASKGEAHKSHSKKAQILLRAYDLGALSKDGA